jgi:hypothetical protein
MQNGTHFLGIRRTTSTVQLVPFHNLIPKLIYHYANLQRQNDNRRLLASQGKELIHGTRKKSAKERESTKESEFPEATTAQSS